jgi:class 3 adenylate cyclase/predicted ATPase
MRCSNCASENPADSAFCEQCGRKLEVLCPACKAPVSAGARFCRKCGASLEILADRVSESEGRESNRAGERRHLTVLFCDLVGSTEIAAQLDPEEWRDLVATYHRAAAEAITRYGGHVAKYLGDGIMAYFGWPAAHDNDAERAARAGLAMLEAIAKLNEQPSRPTLSARVGIDSGKVVVGAGAGKDAEVFGDVPNIAARVQSAAQPDTVLITASAHRLISGLFIVENVGARELKGVPAPIEVFRVIRPTGVRGRIRTARGLTPFVGREEEFATLLKRWERTREGEGQMVLVVGEAGIGKSRLVAEFHERIRDTPHIWMESAGEQLFENTPFHAIIEMLSPWLELQDAKSTEDQLGRLERSLASARLAVAEAAPRIADLLQLPADDRYPALSLTAEQKRRRLLGALAGWVIGAARLQPLVMVVEDLHWLDPSTLELQQLLVEQAATAPLMLLYTARPEFPAQWPQRAHHTQITLNRLSARHVRTIVGQVAAQTVLPAETIAALVERTSGVPLFVEELTRAVLESGDAKRSSREIPATLHDSLMARLDRLGPAKEIIQICAVIGSEFSYELLKAVYPISEDRLQSALLNLTNAELVYVRGIAPDASYLFKHALIRDAAYEALLKSRRRELHRCVATVLHESFPKIVKEHPELLAYHYAEAGLNSQAIPFWQEAGQRAVERSAHIEAIGHLTKGLELLNILSDTPERVSQELSLRIALGVPLAITKGYASPEVKIVYDRVRELCQEVGESPQLCPVLSALWRYYQARAEYQLARKFGDQLLRLAHRYHNRDFMLQAHHALWSTLYLLGEFSLAREHLEQGLVLYDPQQHRFHAFLYSGHDPGTCCRVQRGSVLWYLGYPDQALKSVEEAILLAQQLSHPYSLAVALEGATMVHQFCRDIQGTQQRAETVLTFAREQGFPVYSALATFYQGWTLVEQGLKQEGLNQLRQGIAAYRATGAELGLPYQLAVLAQVYGRTGHVQEALNTLTEALAAAERTSDRRWTAELCRLKGELTLQSRSRVEKEAEESFHQAISIARRQHSKSLELRAVMSLARMWQEQGNKTEARELLGDSYNWFTEGFDTADLKEAKALLDELSG